MIIFLFTHQYFVEKQMMYLHIENRPGTIICIKNILIQNMTHDVINIALGLKIYVQIFI